MCRGDIPLKRGLCQTWFIISFAPWHYYLLTSAKYDRGSNGSHFTPDTIFAYLFAFRFSISTPRKIRRGAPLETKGVPPEKSQEFNFHSSTQAQTQISRLKQQAWLLRNKHKTRPPAGAAPKKSISQSALYLAWMPPICGEYCEVLQKIYPAVDTSSIKHRDFFNEHTCAPVSTQPATHATVPLDNAPIKTY